MVQQLFEEKNMLQQVDLMVATVEKAEISFLKPIVIFQHLQTSDIKENIRQRRVRMAVLLDAQVKVQLTLL